jgi:hypothetical protein
LEFLETWNLVFSRTNPETKSLYTQRRVLPAL